MRAGDPAGAVSGRGGGRRRPVPGTGRTRPTVRAAKVLAHEPRLALIEELVAWGGGRLRQPLLGLPMAHPGAVDVVYDTVGKPETFEVGVRVLTSRGTLVKAGVHTPGRWEWSPLYFKEISWVGSNAFGVEEVDGVRRHAIAHYLELVVAGRVDLRPMLTHTFGLERWREAFLAIADQGASGPSRWPSISGRAPGHGSGADPGSRCRTNGPVRQGQPDQHPKTTPPAEPPE
ncbi:zinc-binding dehydrogenase family protein [Mycobacterium kansasii]|uniref:Zinc-binding dehydrogenase family protein n=1 Tax=Mycobacterium kansasii TaxID=1768 RepID=A0A1V3WK45_MYCKA|nr:zinc-binding dehydrogenase family protein [Mycobacterium kansasii]